MTAKEKHRCEGEVSGAWRDHPCSRNGKYFEDGKWYCKTHAPSTIKERAEKRSNDLANDIVRFRREENLKILGAKAEKAIEQIESEIDRLNKHLEGIPSMNVEMQIKGLQFALKALKGES